jgi:hypothetical protein
MAKHQVDIIIEGYNNASQAFDQVGASLTDMQKRIHSQFGQVSQTGFSEQLKRQFEARGALEDDLFNLTHGAKEQELRDAENYFGTLKIQWQENQSMLTTIEQTEIAKRKSIEDKYAEGSLANFRRYRATYMNIIRTFAVAGIAVRGLEGFTGALVSFRDKGAGEALTTFVNAIPLIGAALNKAGENIAELIVNSNKTIRESNAYLKEQLSLENALDKLLSQKEGTLNEINRLKMSSSELAKYDLEQEKKEQLKLVAGAEATATRMHLFQGLNLLRSAREARLLIDELYKLKEGEPALKKEAEAAEDFEKAMAELNKEIVTFGWSKEGKKIYDLAALGLPEEKEQAYLDKVLQLDKMTKARDLTKELDDTYKNLLKDIVAFGTTGGARQLFDLLGKGASLEQLAPLANLIDKMQKLQENESRNKPLGRLPGWAPFESQHMVGYTAPRIETNYEAQTARNTKTATELLRQLTQVQQQLLQKAGAGEMVTIADIN